MKIISISDSHGCLPNPALVPEGDIFVHAGDICPNFTHHWRNDGPTQMNWIYDKFIPWLNQIRCSRKYIIGGNHDGCAEMPEFDEVLFAQSHAIALRNDLIRDSMENPIIYGSPNTYCPPEYSLDRWAFGHSTDHGLSLIWENLPEQCPIIVTHSPIFNILDSNIGSLSLSNALSNVQFKLHICGHAHDYGGLSEYHGDKLFANSAGCVMGFESYPITGNYQQVFSQPIENLL